MSLNLLKGFFKLIALLASYTTNLNPGHFETHCKDISDYLWQMIFFFQRNEKSSCIDEREWGGRRGVVRPLRSSQLRMLKILTSIFFRYIFAFIYTSEMFLKIIARGFVLNSYTYLRNPWNWLDFTVVIMGYVLFFISKQQYSWMFDDIYFTMSLLGNVL